MKNHIFLFQLLLLSLFAMNIWRVGCLVANPTENAYDNTCNIMDSCEVKDWCPYNKCSKSSRFVPFTLFNLVFQIGVPTMYFSWVLL